MPQNLLIIQDNPGDTKVVREALSNAPDRSFKIDWVRTCHLGLECLALHGKQGDPAADGYSAVLVDLRLPDANGIETFDRVFSATPDIPILVLSSPEDETVARQAVQRGAQDYLLINRLDDYLLPKTIAGIIDRAANTEALFDQKERAQVTLNSIGDAVISTDIRGLVTYLNVVAERLTGWSGAEAIGQPLEMVLKIIDAETRDTVPNPMALATDQDIIVGIPPLCILIRRDGMEFSIEDSSAPIHDRRGRVTGAVMVFHDVSSARAQALKLAHLAQYDSLTDLPNRVLFNDRLTLAIAAAQRHQTALVVLYLDIDRFKSTNDSLGHLVGDRLLQTVALRLSGCVRASDTVCRLGGDEFVILLSEVAHVQDAASFAEKLLNALRMPCVLDEHEIHVTASVGISVYPDDGTEVEALLQNADSAMYEAKSHGRNNYQFYRADLNCSASERQSLERNLRQAIGRGELTLHYQPIIDVATGSLAGAEALLRWNSAVLGDVIPAHFIPIAEESGLIIPIGRWVLREACSQARAWQDRGLPPFRLAVNVSVVELRSRDFVDGVAAILDETGYDPTCLELEITETFLMQDSKSTALVLKALKALGVKLALDDFGTGYSSLSYMRRFPIDTLKVDRSFVSDIASDADDASVVSAVINMGKGLKLRVVAEGVETREQLAFLVDNRCSEAQGFHLSHPLSALAFADYLRNAPTTVHPDTGDG